MKSFIALICLSLVLSSCSAQYNWKDCANAVIDTLRDGLDAIQDGINGQYIHLTQDLAKITADIDKTVKTG